MISSDITDEIDVLKSILGNDFIELSPVWNFPSFLIRLVYRNPQQSDNIPKEINGSIPKEISVTVKFTMNSMYPKTIPKISIESYHGLLTSNQQDFLSDILKVMLAKAKDIIGSMMIYDIIIEAQAFLDKYVDENNINSHKVVKSFYDLMIERENREKNRLEDIRSKKPQNTTEIKIDSPSKLLNMLHTESFDENSEESDEVVDNLDSLSITGNSESSKSDLETSSSNSTDISDRNNDEVNKGMDMFQMSSILPNETSRYQSEFHVLELLGEGASGQVWKVKNKLDRRIYAVKKIILASRNVDINRRIKREVTTISRLFHKNVVRYYAAWIENDIQQQTKPIGRRVSSDSFISKHEDCEDYSIRGEMKHLDSTDQYESIVFEYDSDQEEEEEEEDDMDEETQDYEDSSSLLSPENSHQKLRHEGKLLTYYYSKVYIL